MKINEPTVLVIVGALLVLTVLGVIIFHPLPDTVAMSALAIAGTIVAGGIGALQPVRGNSKPTDQQ